MSVYIPIGISTRDCTIGRSCHDLEKTESVYTFYVSTLHFRIDVINFSLIFKLYKPSFTKTQAKFFICNILALVHN